MFDKLPLFDTLSDISTELSFSKPMWPTKVRFLVNPAEVQNIFSGVFFAVPSSLSTTEMEVLEAAILKGYKELDVPRDIAVKFNKAAKGYTFINELVFRENKLFMNSRRCIVSRYGAYSIYDKVPTYSYNFVSLLCQYIVVALKCPDVELAKAAIAKVRQNTPNFKHAPGVGTIGDTLVIAIDDIVYATDTSDFLERSKELLYSFYDPHSDLSQFIRF